MYQLDQWNPSPSKILWETLGPFYEGSEINLKFKKKNCNMERFHVPSSS